MCSWLFGGLAGDCRRVVCSTKNRPGRWDNPRKASSRFFLSVSPDLRLRNIENVENVVGAYSTFLGFLT